MHQRRTHKHKLLTLLLILAALFLLNGCVPAAVSVVDSWLTIDRVDSNGPAEPVESVVPAESGDTLTDCPEASPGQQLVRNEAAGYCFFIPAGYEAAYLEETGAVIVHAPGSTPGHRERLFVETEEALGRTLAEVTDQVVVNNTIPGLKLEISADATVGGEAATVIGNLPGQDLNRRVIVVHNGRVYQMMFVPDDPQMGQANEEMETLFAAVMASFTFIPPTNPMGLPLPGAQESGYPTDAAFSWQRRILGDGGTVMECQRLDIAADGATWAGSCEQATIQAADAPYQWQEILNRFAPFVYKGGEWDLVFAGQGDVYDPAWQQALGAWAQISYGETTSGRVSAAARTALNWQLGEVEGEAGQCRQLIVLSHGYAYANLVPCQGGDAQTVAEGWLETAEMIAFDNWLYSAAPTYVEDNYLDGRGEQELSNEEITALATWAEELYQRLSVETCERSVVSAPRSHFPKVNSH